MPLKLLELTVHVRVASTFTFVRFDPTPLGKKRFRWENCVFLYTIFLDHEAQINKNSYRTMLFKSTQVSLPKTNSILQEMKIDSKNDMRPLEQLLK